MAILSQDMTDADEQRLIAFWRSLPVWRKMEIMGDLYAAANVLALADLRCCHPDESHEQLVARLNARRRLLEQCDGVSPAPMHACSVLTEAPLLTDAIPRV